MSNLTHFSLFAGIGGIDLAAEWAGFKTVGQCEIDKFCQQVLDKHWPGVPKWGDIFELTGKEILDKCGRISLLSGGFPCQPFSAAGKRKGEKDKRHLWPEFYRIICEVKPTWVLAENVRGLLSIDAGRTFGVILSDLAESGYRVGWLCYGAGDVGAPHRRERVFIVAHSASVERDAGAKVERVLREVQENGPERNNLNGSSEARNSDVAHSDSEQANKQLRQSCRSCRQQGQPMEAGKKAARPQDRKAGNNNITGLCKALADTENSNRWRADGEENIRRGHTEAGGRNIKGNRTEYGAAQSCLGGMPHGVSTGLYRYKWPAGPGEQYDWEPPRIATGVKGRMARLKALGNAVCPQQIFPILRAIAEIERGITK